MSLYPQFMTFCHLSQVLFRLYLVIIGICVRLGLFGPLCACSFLRKSLSQHLIDVQSGRLLDTIGNLGYSGHDVPCQLAGIATEHLDGIYVHVALSHSLCDLGQLLEVYFQSIQLHLLSCSIAVLFHSFRFLQNTGCLCLCFCLNGFCFRLTFGCYGCCLCQACCLDCLCRLLLGESFCLGFCLFCLCLSLDLEEFGLRSLLSLILLGICLLLCCVFVCFCGLLDLSFQSFLLDGYFSFL